MDTVLRNCQEAILFGGQAVERFVVEDLMWIGVNYEL